LKKAFGGRVRILIEDESEIAKMEDDITVVVDGKKHDDGQAELTPLKSKESTRRIDPLPNPETGDDSVNESKKTLEEADVEFLTSSESDSDYSSDEIDQLKHATVETASESLRDFRITEPKKHRRHRHRRRARPVPVVPHSYGTATTSHIPILPHGFGDDADYDGGDSSPGIQTKSYSQIMSGSNQ